jgi:hypothetical protein
VAATSRSDFLSRRDYLLVKARARLLCKATDVCILSAFCFRVWHRCHNDPVNFYTRDLFHGTPHITQRNSHFTYIVKLNISLEALDVMRVTAGYIILRLPSLLTTVHLIDWQLYCHDVPSVELSAVTDVIAIGKFSLLLTNCSSILAFSTQHNADLSAYEYKVLIYVQSKNDGLHDIFCIDTWYTVNFGFDIRLLAFIMDYIYRLRVAQFL